MSKVKIPNNSWSLLARIFFAASLILIWTIPGLGCKTKARKKTPRPGDKIYSVATFQVTLEEISQSLDVKGTFIPSDKLDVKSEVDGKIASVAVNEGQVVNVGDALVSINPEQLKLLLDKQRLELREQETKAEGGALAQPFMGIPSNLRGEAANQGNEEEGQEEAEPPSEPEPEKPVSPEGMGEGPAPSAPPGGGNYEKPEGLSRAEEAAQDRIRAEIALTEKKIESANVTAAIAGIVSKKNVTEGSAVAPGEILFQIVKIDPIWISVFVPAETVAALKPEEKPEVKVDELPDQTFTGEIVYVSPEPDPQNKNYEIKVSTPNTQLKVKGGMSGSVLLSVAQMRKATMVPEAALITKGGNKYVYVVKDQVAERKEVDLGKKVGEKYEVKRGLREGDVVVIKGQQDFTEEQEYVKVESL
jgi:multidrug efflux pump subunit AcrA (membrane-fusion protein)